MVAGAAGGGVAEGAGSDTPVVRTSCGVAGNRNGESGSVSIPMPTTAITTATSTITTRERKGFPLCLVFRDNTLITKYLNRKPFYAILRASRQRHLSIFRGPVAFYSQPELLVNIRHLILLVGSFAVAVESRSEQDPALEGFAVDPYAPISTWAVCPPPPDRDYHLYYSGDPEEAPTQLQGNLAERTGAGKLTLIGDAERQGMIAGKFGEAGKITFLGAHYTGGNDLVSLHVLHAGAGYRKHTAGLFQTALQPGAFAQDRRVYGRGIGEHQGHVFA